MVMNKKFFESLLNIIMVAAISSCVISCGDDDVTINPGTGNEGDSNTDEVCVGTAVDIGLSVKFADRNVGAKNTEDLGILYAWGETETKADFSLENYFDQDYTKVTSDICGTEYDVARKKWGAPWRMMTWSEVEEIERNCTLETVIQNGVKGMRITGPNGNSIFMPYSYEQAGFCQTGVWTGKIMKNPYGAASNSVAYLAIFTNYAIDGPALSTHSPGDNRYKGYYVRAVCEK